MSLTQDFFPDLEVVFNHSMDPEAFTYAIIDELGHVMEFLCSYLHVNDEESVKWILMELTANAITAPTGYLLGIETNLTKGEMLTAFGTSVIWPDLSTRKLSVSSQESVIRIEQVLGRSIPEWLSMSLKDRIDLLGLTPTSNWVQIRTDIDNEQNCFSLSVVSAFPPLKGDIEAIRCRFESNDETSSRIQKERTRFEDEDGIYHMPSFTGGGGMGLLACIRLAREKGLFLDYAIPEDTGSGIFFILGNQRLH